MKEMRGSSPAFLHCVHSVHSVHCVHCSYSKTRRLPIMRATPWNFASS